MVLLLDFMQLTRDLIAIAKFLFPTKFGLDPFIFAEDMAGKPYRSLAKWGFAELKHASQVFDDRPY